MAKVRQLIPATSTVVSENKVSTMTMDYGVYSDIAFSDSVNCLAAVYCALTASKIHLNDFMAAGFALVGVAAFFGILRFGWKPRAFAHINSFCSAAAGAIGFPLIMLSLVPPSHLAHLLDLRTIAATLVVVFAVSKLFFSPKQADTALAIANVLSIATLSISSFRLGRLLPLVACAVFLTTTAIIGPDRNRYLWGQRRENLFHYGLAASMYLFVTCAEDKPLYGSFYL